MLWSSGMSAPLGCLFSTQACRNPRRDRPYAFNECIWMRPNRKLQHLCALSAQLNAEKTLRELSGVPGLREHSGRGRNVRHRKLVPRSRIMCQEMHNGEMATLHFPQSQCTCLHQFRILNGPTACWEPNLWKATAGTCAHNTGHKCEVFFPTGFSSA